MGHLHSSQKQLVDTRDIFVSLHAGELRKGIEMCVAGTQNERMLQYESRDPHIVGRDGSALLAQLAVNGAVMVRRLFVRIEHTDARLQEKTAQDSFVARSLTAHSKAGAQFSQHNEG